MFISRCVCPIWHLSFSAVGLSDWVYVKLNFCLETLIRVSGRSQRWCSSVEQYGKFSQISPPEKGFLFVYWRTVAFAFWNVARNRTRTFLVYFDTNRLEKENWELIISETKFLNRFQWKNKELVFSILPLRSSANSKRQRDFLKHT